jgi:deazaflavin-dependent oxidoreductase (nitroreductase family)
LARAGRTAPRQASARALAWRREPRSGAATAEPDVLHLTTTGRRTGRPREVEIWFTRRAGRHYLVAETGGRAHWVRNILADPRVAWRVGDERFAGHARVIDPAREPELVAAVRALSVAKYGWGDGLVVELAPEAPRLGRG